MPSFDQTPDLPVSFGHCVSWFAVSTSDPARVVDALDLGEGTSANWASGLAAAAPTRASSMASKESGPWIFVSPPVSGWTLIVGDWLPCPYARTEQRADIGQKFDVLFSRLMKHFADVQFFTSNRVADFYVWARAQGGESKRVFTFGDGTVYENIGKQTPEEAKLKLANFSGLTASAAGEKFWELVKQQEAERSAFIAKGLSFREAMKTVLRNGRSVFPNERDVADLAELWSVNPEDLESEDHPVGLGWVFRLPESLKP